MSDKTTELLKKELDRLKLKRAEIEKENKVREEIEEEKRKLKELKPNFIENFFKKRFL